MDLSKGLGSNIANDAIRRILQQVMLSVTEDGRDQNKSEIKDTKADQPMQLGQEERKHLLNLHPACCIQRHLTIFRCNLQKPFISNGPVPVEFDGLGNPEKRAAYLQDSCFRT